MGQRNREREDKQPFEFQLVGYTDVNGVHSSYIYGLETWIRKSEKMQDTVGFMKCDYNPCYHEKFHTAAEPLHELAIEKFSGVYEYYTFEGGGLMVHNLLEVLINHDFGIGDQLDDFGVTALDHFVTTVQDENSLLNFLYECKDLCELNLKEVTKVSLKLRGAIDTFFRMIRKGAGYWVAWNFAIRPTISDIHSMLTAVEKANKRLKWLREWNHRPVKVKYRENPGKISGTIAVDPSWLHPVPGGTPFVLPQPVELGAELKYECELKLSAWAEIQFDIPDYLLDDWHLAVGMIILTQQGIYNPLKVVWEAIPFSWLIDWLTNKRVQLLKELANLSPFPPARVLQVGHTVHFKQMVGTTYIVVNEFSGIRKVEIGVFDFDRFDRRPGLPTGDSLVRPPVLDLRQASILAGIAVNSNRRR
jgi:hypothetical protein